MIPALQPFTPNQTNELARILAALKTTLYSHLDQVIPQGYPCLFADIPLYLNVGDILIYLGTKEYLRDRGITVISESSLVDNGSLLPPISKSVPILLQGGGNLGDIWPEHEDYRYHIMATYPDNPVIILPQSIHFSSPASIKRAVSHYSRHKRLILLVRDQESYSFATNTLKCKAILCPDMAHALYGTLTTESADVPAKCLSFYRRDKEMDQATKHQSTSIDWADLIRIQHRIAFHIIFRLWAHWPRSLSIKPLNNLWYYFTKKIGSAAASDFAHYQTVSTDRLHAFILATLLKRRVFLGDNSYGKLSRYRNAWLPILSPDSTSTT